MYLLIKDETSHRYLLLWLQFFYFHFMFCSRWAIFAVEFKLLPRLVSTKTFTMISVCGKLVTFEKIFKDFQRFYFYLLFMLWQKFHPSGFLPTYPFGFNFKFFGHWDSTLYVIVLNSYCTFFKSFMFSIKEIFYVKRGCKSYVKLG